MKVIDIEKWLTEKYKSINTASKAAFFTAFALGFIIHIASISGWLVNWDSLNTLLDDSVYLVAQGKWFFPVVQKLKAYLGAASLCGPLALLYIAVSAGLTVSVLEIRRPLCGALTGGLMVSFLSVMCTFTYSGEDVFFFALMLSALAVYCTVKYRRGYIAGIVLLTLSVGTYQTYIGFAAALFVLYCLMQLIYTKKDEKEIAGRGLVMIGVLLAAVAAYYIILRLLLATGRFELSGYHNVDSMMEKPSFGEIIDVIKSAPVRTLQFFIYDAFGTGFARLRVMYIMTIVLTALAGAYVIVRTRIYRRPVRLVIATALVVLLPLAVNIIAVLSRSTTTHWIMIYPFVLLFILPVKLADAKDALPEFDDQKRGKETERFDGRCDIAASAVHSLSIVLTAALIFTWGVYTNHGYTRMKLAYENAYAKCESISERVMDVYYEQDNAESADKPRVAIVGMNWRDQPSDDMFSYMDSYTGVSGENFLTSSDHYGYMLTTYLGQDFTFSTASESWVLAREEEVQAMPVYPARGSVKQYGEWIVVKVC